jgi:glycosyltransferase involved in cell wall biosynthesis
MELRAEHITIAVTVYSRRDYVLQAIRSALNQTVPVKVIVVEDCGPDPSLRAFITHEFGGRIEYFRNPRNRGLFDNWNACLEYCRTPWLSILHDDDWLHPNFVETLLHLAKQAPDRALYFGRAAILEPDGRTRPPPGVSWPDGWQEIDAAELANHCFLLFPGNLFAVQAALAAGRFRKNSYFTGDWDMWFGLTRRGGAAQSAMETAVVRAHYGLDRGSSLVLRKGWKWLLDNVQRKRNLARLQPQKGGRLPFDRLKPFQESPLSARLLLRFAGGFSRRVLHYNWWLFIHSRPLNWRYVALQWLARALGPRSLRLGAALARKRFNES